MYFDTNTQMCIVLKDVLLYILINWTLFYIMSVSDFSVGKCNKYG